MSRGRGKSQSGRSGNTSGAQTAAIQRAYSWVALQAASRMSDPAAVIGAMATAEQDACWFAGKVVGLKTSGTSRTAIAARLSSEALHIQNREA